MQQRDTIPIRGRLDACNRVIGAAIVDNEQMIRPLPNVMRNPFLYIQAFVFHNSQNCQGIALFRGDFAAQSAQSGAHSARPGLQVTNKSHNDPSPS
jgi:hypothetical protein